MPFALPRLTRLAAACALAVAALHPAARADSSDLPANSNLDAPLFYQLLVGELELNSGEPGVAYQVLLDAARRSQDEALFKRVVQIALQGRAGDQALTAAKAWRDALPQSVEAHQTVIQLLALMNRPKEIGAPLQSLLKLHEDEQANKLIRSLPSLFSRSPEPVVVLEALQPILESAASKDGTRQAATLTLARFQLQAGQDAKAMALTARAAEQDPLPDEVLGLALELMGKYPQAEALIQKALQAQPDNQALRQSYGRALARSQRLAEAAREFRIVTEAIPDEPSPWFALGSLELELRHTLSAEAALRTFLLKLEAVGQPDGSALSEAGRDTRQQAWLLLAQVAEQRQDWKAAKSWLDKLDTQPMRADVQYRRALLTAKQGQLEQGRALIRELPSDTPEKLRIRFLAETQLLREMQQWPAALEVLRQANEQIKDDPDLLYEQSMMAEKLDKLDDMETLLRRVIALEPKHFHAYNALGYSLADRKLRLDEARELIVKALSFAPKEPSIVDSMGWVEFRLGHFSEAENWLRQAYASRPDADIAAHLGEVLWAAGQQEEARKIWTEGVRRDPGNEAIRDTLQRLQVKL